MDYITDITGYGVSALALVLVFKLAANHIQHSTKAITELREAIIELTLYLKSRQ